MGGVDKGLQMLDGRPLVEHALARLAPQVGTLAINANRHLEAYAAFGVPVWADADAEFAGPLAGMLAGLRACRTRWLVTVPCDTPLFPQDLVARLAAATAIEHEPPALNVPIAIAATVDAATGAVQPQPVFCLMNAALRDDLAEALATGERKIDRWTARHHAAAVRFDDAEAFFNANTQGELARLASRVTLRR
jgi:molybdenum cofactor guanylyltransferase